MSSSILSSISAALWDDPLALKKIKDLTSKSNQMPKGWKYDMAMQEYVFSHHTGKQISMTPEEFKRFNEHMAINVPPVGIGHVSHITSARQDTAAYSDGFTSEEGLMKSLLNRMRIHPGELVPFSFIRAHYSGDKVFVFVVQGGQAVTLEDTWALYPSDDLVTKLRLIK